MKDKIILVGVLMFAVAALVFSDFGRNTTVVYDCRDAHWHPDVPIEVKKQCREIMKERLEEMQREERLKKYTLI